MWMEAADKLAGGLSLLLLEWVAVKLVRRHPWLSSPCHVSHSGSQTGASHLDGQ